MPGKKERRRRERQKRRLSYQELSKRREGARYARTLQRAQPEVILELEVMFFALGTVMREWISSDVEIDKHGDMEGNNPHVWLPRVTQVTIANGILLSGTSLAQDGDNFFWDNTNNRLGIGTDNGQTLKTVETGEDGEVRVHDSQCTCGLTLEQWDGRIAKQRNRMWRMLEEHDEEISQQSFIRVMLNGLQTRDVQ